LEKSPEAEVCGIKHAPDYEEKAAGHHPPGLLHPAVRFGGHLLISKDANLSAS
jgi:hypothetical protein